MVKEQSLSVLIKTCDEVFSKYVRKKNSVNGYCYCFICSKALKISEAQLGHYIDRDQMPTRFDEMNGHPVCEHCNCYDPKHKSMYEWMMNRVYGEDEVQKIRIKSRLLQKFMRHELIEIIEKYKAKLRDL